MPYQSPPPSLFSPLLLAAAEAKVDVNGVGILVVEIGSRNRKCGFGTIYENEKRGAVECEDLWRKWILRTSNECLRF